MKTGFIGAGKVGCSLGRYFTRKRQGGLGLSVEGYFSRSVESAKEAARFTDSKPYESIEGLIKQCDVIFLTVPDGSIGSVWQQVRRCDINGKTICHCSGAMSAQDAFEGIEETGAFGYSVHPLFAVSDKYNAYRELTGVFFTLEGDGASEKAPGQGRHGTFHELQRDPGDHGEPYLCYRQQGQDYVSLRGGCRQQSGMRSHRSECGDDAQMWILRKGCGEGTGTYIDRQHGACSR